MENEFFSELVDLYRKNQKRIETKLFLQRRVLLLLDPGPVESRLRMFCSDLNGRLSHSNLCLLALVFFNVLGERLPDHIHARIMLGEVNKWVKEYVSANSEYKPKFLWFNINPNRFRNCTLGYDGQIRRMTLK